MLRPTRLRSAGIVLSLAALVAAPFASPAAAEDADPVGGPGLAGYGIRVNLGDGAKPLPAVAAKSWVLVDITTGEVLASKAAHRQGRPASTLKTLTALTLMPVLDKDADHTATWDEAAADGGRVGIVPDATYTNWDLWHGLLLPSGNDAAAALADAHGGMKKTVSDMQAKAAEIQADDTVVRNASGLDADGQLTSAYDLALIARAALELEDFREVTSSVSYDFPGRPHKNGTRPTYKIYTQNRLLLHGFDGTVGGKTGYTTLAGRTFWGAAERNGHTLVVALLQVKERTETAATDLLTWGFANRTKVTPVGTLVDPLPEGGEAVAPTESGAAPVPSEDAGAGGAARAPVGDATSGPSPVLIALVAALGVGGAVTWRARSLRPEAVGVPAGVVAVSTASPVTPQRKVVPGPSAAEPPQPAPAAGNVRIVTPPKPPAE